MNVQMESSRILLRPIQYSDTDKIISWRNSEEIRQYFIYQEPFTRESHEKWLREVIFREKGFQFVIVDKQSGEDIGSAYLRDYDKKHQTAEYGIFLDGLKRSGNGIGTEALKLLVDFAFEQLKLHKIRGRIFADNVRSLRISEKAGFEREALLKEEVLVRGNYRDIVLVGQINPKHVLHKA